MPAEVAVAVVSWNTRDLLARCLESLRPDAESGLAEVWVVDNDSTDGSADLVPERFGWAELVQPGSNIGFGAAVNLVAERSSTPWLAPANADIELRPGALAALLEAGAREPGAGALAPLLERPGGGAEHSVHSFPTPLPWALGALGAARFTGALGDRLCLPGAWDPARERAVPWALGAFLLVRREAWEQSGGFPPDRWLYAEDLELGWQLREHGWSTRFVPGAVAEHTGGAAAEQAFGSERDRRWMDASYSWVASRRGTVRARALAALAVAGSLVRAGVLAPAALLAPRLRPALREALRWAGIHARGLRA